VIARESADQCRSEAARDWAGILASHNVCKFYGLVGCGPAELVWVRRLYGLLEELNFLQVHKPESIEPLLQRWTQLDDANSDGVGYFTGLSLIDEFRCLIASLYGTTCSNRKTVVQKDVAMRCAFYGNANLKEKELRAGYERDQDVFVFAALNNGNLFSSSSLEKCLRRRCWATTLDPAI
jgi:hypothetical protein